MKINARKRFVHPNRDQFLLLPPDMNQWLKKEHFARFLTEVLDSLDFSAFYREYVGDEESMKGRPPFSPDLIVGLLFYALTKGALSSRAVEELAYTDVGARFLTGDHQPDHACICRFKLRHSEAIRDLFSQIVLLCHEAGLVDLKNVALDSTPCKANVAPNSAIKVENLQRSWEKSRARAQRLMQQMEEADKADAVVQERLKRQLKESDSRSTRIQDAMKFLNVTLKVESDATPAQPTHNCESDGKGDPTKVVGGETPGDATSEEKPKLTPAQNSKNIREEVGRRIHQARLAKQHDIQKNFAAQVGMDVRLLCDIEKGRRAPNAGVRAKLAEALELDPKELEVPKFAPDKKKPKVTSINITDRDCYITFKPSKGWVKGFLGQVACDSKNQIIIDGEISTKNTDQEYLPSFIARCRERFGELPELVTSDTNYCSGGNLRLAESTGIDYYCAVSPHAGKSDHSDPDIVKMREKLATPAGRAIYSTRCGVVEAIFSRLYSQLKFTRFNYRGLAKVNADWLLALTGLNLISLYQAIGRGR